MRKVKNKKKVRKRLVKPNTNQHREIRNLVISNLETPPTLPNLVPRAFSLAWKRPLERGCHPLEFPETFHGMGIF